MIQPPAASIPTKWAGASLIWSAPPCMYFYEFYTDSFGIASEDAHVYDAREIIGWLNYLFQAAMTTAGPATRGASTSCCQTTGGMMIL